MTTKKELNRIKIQTLSSQNLLIKEIAEIVGVDYKTAKKWSKKVIIIIIIPNKGLKFRLLIKD